MHWTYPSQESKTQFLFLRDPKQQETDAGDTHFGCQPPKSWPKLLSCSGTLDVFIMIFYIYIKDSNQLFFNQNFLTDLSFSNKEYYFHIWELLSLFLPGEILLSAVLFATTSLMENILRMNPEEKEKAQKRILVLGSSIVSRPAESTQILT